jgi:hypothetical protein
MPRRWPTLQRGGRLRQEAAGAGACIFSPPTPPPAPIMPSPPGQAQPGAGRALARRASSGRGGRGAGELGATLGTRHLCCRRVAGELGAVLLARSERGGSCANKLRRRRGAPGRRRNAFFFIFHCIIGLTKGVMSMSAGVLVLNANSALTGGPAMSDLVSIHRQSLINANCNKLQKILVLCESNVKSWFPEFRSKVAVLC